MEFESLVNRTEGYLRIERSRVMFDVGNLFGDQFDVSQNCQAAFDRIDADIRLAKETIANNNLTIQAASGFAALSKWDEVISILLRQRLAAEELLTSTEASSPGRARTSPTGRARLRHLSGELR